MHPDLLGKSEGDPLKLGCGCVVDTRRQILVGTCGWHRITREAIDFLEHVHEASFFKESKLVDSRYQQLQRIRKMMHDETTHPYP
jgi:hypothetical protein